MMAARKVRMTNKPTHAGGFSLIELLVSVVIGLLALVFATRLITGSEQNKSSALGGSDSMQNGMLAMFSISGDAQQAGFGLNDPLLVGCHTQFYDRSGYVLANATRGSATIQPLAPAVIGNGGTGPDTITLYSGSSMSGTGTLRMTSNYIGGTRVDVDRIPYGFNLGDVVVVAPDNIGDGNCALAQISADPSTLAAPPSQQFVMVAGGTGFRYNSGALGNNYNAGMARLFNLGPGRTLSFHTWSVANGFLQLRSTDLAGTGGGAQAVADNIVSIKAQYGFDTRTGGAFTPQTGLQVRRWSTAMIDADGDSAVGGAGDYQHIAALRIAVVARSAARERPAANGVCTATTVLPTVFGSVVPTGVTAQEVTVGVDTGVPDWRCYRYRVFETIVPLRNAGWRPA